MITDVQLHTNKALHWSLIIPWFWYDDYWLPGEFTIGWLGLRLHIYWD